MINDRTPTFFTHLSKKRALRFIAKEKELYFERVCNRKRLNKLTNI